MQAVLDLGSNNASVNCSVVKPNLLPAVEPFDFLFAVLHQLLGTGNDVRDEILCLSDNFFETWSDERIDAFDNLQEAQAEVDNLVTQNCNNDAYGPGHLPGDQNHNWRLHPRVGRLQSHRA